MSAARRRSTRAALQVLFCVSTLWLPLDKDRRLTRDPALPNEVERSRKFFKGKRFCDWRLQLAALPQAEDLRLRLSNPLRCALSIVAPLQATDADVLHEKVIRLDRGNIAADKPDHNEPPAPRECAQRSAKELATDWIEHDVDAGTIRLGKDLFPQFFAQVRTTDIDDSVGAAGTDEFSLLRLAHRGEHARSKRLGKLDAGNANTARGAADQHCLTRVQTCAVAQRKIGRLIDEPHGGRLRETKSSRQVEGILGPDQGLLGEGAMFELGKHTIAPRET